MSTNTYNPQDTLRVQLLFQLITHANVDGAQFYKVYDDSDPNAVKVFIHATYHHAVITMRKDSKGVLGLYGEIFNINDSLLYLTQRHVLLAECLKELNKELERIDGDKFFSTQDQSKCYKHLHVKEQKIKNFVTHFHRVMRDDTIGYGPVFDGSQSVEEYISRKDVYDWSAGQVFADFIDAAYETLFIPDEILNYLAIERIQKLAKYPITFQDVTRGYGQCAQLAIFLPKGTLVLS